MYPKMVIKKSDNNYFLSGLLSLAIILMPFNSLPYFRSIFGEMAVEGAFYPLLLGIVIWFGLFLTGRIIYAPNDKIFYLLIVFILWAAVSGVANLGHISGDILKGRTGVEKYINQMVVLTFGFFSMLFIFNVTRNKENLLLYVRRFVLYSFIIVGLYSVFEIAYLLFGSIPAQNILETINVYIRSNISMYGRIRSVCGEASWFAMYCSFALPWLMSYIFTEHKNRWIYILISCYAITLLILSYSRTAYFITALQLVFFFYLTRNVFWQRFRIVFFTIALIILVGLIGNTVLTTTFEGISIPTVYKSIMDMDNMSNVARLASQSAAWNIAKDHPIIGVGIGQYGFYMSEYVPWWSYASWEIRNWADSTEGTAWPPVHGLYPRIAAETGFIGLILWLLIWVGMFIKLYSVFKHELMYGNIDYLLIALMTSYAGVILAGFNSDTIRFPGYWLILGISFVYLIKRIVDYDESANDGGELVT